MERSAERRKNIRCTQTKIEARPIFACAHEHRRECGFKEQLFTTVYDSYNIYVHITIKRTARSIVYVIRIQKNNHPTNSIVMLNDKHEPSDGVASVSSHTHPKRQDSTIIRSDANNGIQSDIASTKSLLEEVACLKQPHHKLRRSNVSVHRFDFASAGLAGFRRLAFSGSRTRFGHRGGRRHGRRTDINKIGSNGLRRSRCTVDVNNGRFGNINRTRMYVIRFNQRLQRSIHGRESLFDGR